MEDIYVLGINENHDSSAALCKNGKIIYAVAQERITRKKHHEHEIRESIEYVLNAAGIMLKDLAAVVSCIHGSFECDQIYSQIEFKDLIKSQIPLLYCHPSHHELHALSACLTSPFEESAVMICDGLGSAVSNTIYDSHDKLQYFEGESFYQSNGTDLKTIWRKCTTHYPYEFEKEDISLGRLYSYVSKYIFETRYDAGKVMALASFCKSGNNYPSFIEVKNENVKVVPERLKIFRQPINNKSDSLKHASLAFQVQKDLEEALLYNVNKLHSITKSENLCFAGGVALNCQANSRILEEGKFRNMHIMSAPTDDGVAIGAALYGYHILLNKPWKPWNHYNPYLGKKYSNDDILNSIEKECLNQGFSVMFFDHDYDSLCDYVSSALMRGKIIAWFQGGSEFGPRALGNRSILANPSVKGLRDFININIKERELFRPFSPSILEEHCPEYFKVSNNFSNPLMLLTADVKENVKDLISEVIHIDGSARVQTVTKRLNKEFYALIESFYEHSGIPMLLNTSFNGKGQPIVETPSEAINMFIKKPIDILVLGSYVISK